MDDVDKARLDELEKCATALIVALMRDEDVMPAMEAYRDVATPLLILELIGMAHANQRVIDLCRALIISLGKNPDDADWRQECFDQVNAMIAGVAP